MEGMKNLCSLWLEDRAPVSHRILHLEWGGLTPTPPLFCCKINTGADMIAINRYDRNTQRKPHTTREEL